MSITQLIHLRRTTLSLCSVISLNDTGKETNNDIAMTIYNCIQYGPAIYIQGVKLLYFTCAHNVCVHIRFALLPPSLHLATHSFTLALSCVREFSSATAVHGTGPIHYFFNAVKIGCWNTKYNV